MAYPDTIIDREKEQGDLANAFSKSIRSYHESKKLRGPLPVFIYGDPGTGKTTLGRCLTDKAPYLFGDVPIKFVYVPCDANRSRHRIFKWILAKLGLDHHSRVTDDLLERIMKYVSENSVILVPILDEITFIPSKDRELLFYNLLTPQLEVGAKGVLSLILISNDSRVLKNIQQAVDSRVSTRAFTQIVFSEYKQVDIEKIIRLVAKLAIVPKCITEPAIEKIAEYTVNRGGDARRAIGLLHQSAIIAPRLGSQGKSPLITPEIITKTIPLLEERLWLKQVEGMRTEKQLVFYSLVYLQLITPDQIDFPFSTIYRFYLDICRTAKLRPKADRTVDDYLDELEASKFVVIKQVSLGRRKGGGLKNYIRLKIHEDEFLILFQVLSKSLGIEQKDPRLKKILATHD